MRPGVPLRYAADGFHVRAAGNERYQIASPGQHTAEVSAEAARAHNLDPHGSLTSRSAATNFTTL